MLNIESSYRISVNTSTHANFAACVFKVCKHFSEVKFARLFGPNYISGYLNIT